MVSVAFDFDCTYMPQVLGTVPSTLAAVKLEIVGTTEDGTESFNVQVLLPILVLPL